MAPPGFPKERRKKTHGLYFHSSPPKVLQMNNQNLQRDNDVRARDVIKPSNIRIWLHQKRMSKLAKVLWAGQGMRLRTETSHHPKMKRFLECVPHVMGVIKDIHQAVVDNDLETLKEKTAAPMPRIVLTSKDTNGLTPLHKAAGLAHTQIVEYILSIWPSLSSDEDHTGKTPLHWAASAKNNARSFNLLVQAGADEAALDNRDKQAEYYKNKPSEIDRSLLTVIPEAPRISQQGFPAYFDWSMFTLDEDCDDSNGSQARMEPFLSQNNLLDNDVNNPSSVSKSKSVHNLTNGTLTDLPNDPDQNEPKNNGESEQQDTEENLIEAASVIPEDLQQNDRGDVEESKPTNSEIIQTEAESVVDSAKENEPDTATEDIETGEQTENKNIEAPKQNDNLANNNEVDNGWLELVENGQENGENRDEESVKNDNQTAAMVNGGIEQNDVPAEAINQLDSEGNVQETVENAKNLEDGELVEQENGSENIDKDNSDKADNYVDTSEVDENKNDQNFEKSSNESTTIDVNGNLGDTNDAQSRQSSAKLKENNITTLEQTSRPVSTHSAKQNELQTKSAASVRSSVNSAKSASAKSIRSASTASQNNNDEILAEPAASVDGIQSTHTSRPSTTISNNSKSASSRAASTASTVRNASAGSALQNGRQSAKSSATAKETRPDQDGLENEEEDSNDDSNQADVEIVHYKASDEDANKDRFSAKARNDQSGVQEPPNEATDGETIEVPFNKEQIAIINNGPLESITQNDDAAASKAINATNYPENAPDSPSSTLAIEGTVEGEPDAGQLHSAKPVNRLDSSHGRSLQDIINSGDMEQLAVIVLDGKGSKLLGYRSELPEIQAFLENVPSYMNKIRRVHTAARKGSLRDLQSALDRRKFATAKDEISPHGATPLHVATIFGHSGIVRYLAGRFPETTGATDDQGRTPLHYAATLKDNGHFYNLLTHLGANPKAEDNLNHPAEFYLNHDEANELLSHRQLLQDYGAEEDLVDEMLSDQEHNGSQVEIPLFRTEEGRYLATSLGDPLIKGLTENRSKTSASSQTSAGKNDRNNNSIEFEIKQDSEKELESSARTEETAQVSPRQNGKMAESEMERDDQGPPSRDGSGSATTSDNRDEHGQSMLHFACARSHGKNALIQLIEESGTSITFRDELYRTARDVSLQATQPDNAREIDRYVLGLAARGDLELLSAMLLDGYDHIVDVTGSDGTTIMQVASSRGHREIVRFLEGAREFEENREDLLNAVRERNLQKVVEITQQSDGNKLAKAKNYYGRSALHIAVVMESEEIVEYLATNFKQTLKIGDNLERTPLHYAMGVGNVEAISRILIKNGAKRVSKDLKGRQPSYYFMNKADILRLQEEEKQ
ncbi:uncharacterized protein LOC129729856 isoform X8 [Wyeomyia smithii]|uniref:uncharacterized protein LOC129729856 isoform X8 n=1 Tax=Wyeomyia smithii TaxID=174621 RepID=UPI002467B763|nr:uncharacterized protein LOC129729856 isoform X8 [Wyeomyia smithii]